MLLVSRNSSEWVVRYQILFTFPINWVVVRKTKSAVQCSVMGREQSLYRARTECSKSGMNALHERESDSKAECVEMHPDYSGTLNGQTFNGKSKQILSLAVIFVYEELTQNW